MVTCLTFGLGVAFLLFGLPVVLRVSADWKLRAWLAYLSIGWLLVSWWPHGHLHQHNGHDVQGLLYIEYGFHVPPDARRPRRGLLLLAATARKVGQGAASRAFIGSPRPNRAGVGAWLSSCPYSPNPVEGVFCKVPARCLLKKYQEYADWAMCRC